MIDFLATFAVVGLLTILTFMVLGVPTYYYIQWINKQVPRTTGNNIFHTTK